MPSHHPIRLLFASNRDRHIIAATVVPDSDSSPFSFPSRAAMLGVSGPDQQLSSFTYGGGEFESRQVRDRENLWSGGIRFETSGARESEGEDSGVCSPPLWKATSPSSSPSAGGSSPRHRRARDLSPASRTQAIARGRRELMDMVRTMPETSYELSLKDLVEHHHHHRTAEIQDTKNRKEKRDSKKTRLKRSESLDNGGFFLKIVFPIRILGSKKNKNSKKNSGINGNTCAKVSPKPPRTNSSSDGSGKGGEKEWWKKRLEASSGSQSSSNCSSNSSSKSSRYVL